MADHTDSTDCVHGVHEGQPGGSPIAPSLVRSTNFRMTDEAYRARREGEGHGHMIYARELNPTVQRVEAHLAHLEAAERCLLFASGMAALHAILMGTLERGQNVVLARQVYGNSLGLMRALLPRLGVELRRVDVYDFEGIRAAVDANTRLFCCESISNPLTRIADLPQLAGLLEERADSALLVVDSTLAGPAAQRPLNLGADLVWHSASKSLAGHSDVIGGAVCGGQGALEELWHWRSMAGGCMDPAGAWLLERGLRTLALRVRAQSENALAVARFLEQHPAVERVEYCGLEAHPDHELMQSHLEYGGGLLSFMVRGGDDRAKEVMRRLELIEEAASLGGVESLVTRPKDLSQSGLSAEELSAVGIPPGTLRLALGIESAADLVADLSQALAQR